MNQTNPANLGVIACPGGEVFADKVIEHLKRVYRRLFNNKIAELSKKYDLENSAAIRQVNLLNDILSPFHHFQDKNHKSDSGESVSNCESYHSPRFKVPTKFTMFPNGEIKTEILESIRRKDLYIVQDVENHYPVYFSGSDTKKVLSVNDHLLTLFVTIDAVRHAGAGRVTLVMPVYPYSRQHRAKGREGLTAGRIGKILESLGVNRIITLDIHSREINNAFDRMQLENLHASYQIIRVLSGIPGIINDDLVVVSPDTGAVDRNKFYATALKKPLALLYKERDYSIVSTNAVKNNISEIKLLGDVRGKNVFMADDMLGTGGTLLKAMEFLKEQGAGKVICAISLPLFTGDALGYFDEAYKKELFYKIIGTNAVYQEEPLQREWYMDVNITGLFAKTISRLHRGLSLSSLLDNREIIFKHLQSDQS